MNTGKNSVAHKNQTNYSPLKKSFKTMGGGHRRPQKIYSEEEANDRLFDIFRNHDMGHVSHSQRQMLARFYVLLMQKQQTQNFTRLIDFKDVAIKHFIDCLIVDRLVQLKFPLLDVGTGPGFPGIPLKILHPDQTLMLAESVQKRVEFLKEVREELQLKHMPIVGRAINEYFAYPVQGVITRAVEDARNTLKNVLTSLQTGGYVYLMKGPNVGPELKLAKEEMSEFYQLEKDIAYSLPGTKFERRLLVYRKIKAAPLPDFENEPEQDP